VSEARARITGRTALLLFPAPSRVRVRPTSMSPAAASATRTGTRPSAALRDVASTGVPTVRGASTTANELIVRSRGPGLAE
jgi:hypothetical protein